MYTDCEVRYVTISEQKSICLFLTNIFEVKCENKISKLYVAKELDFHSTATKFILAYKIRICTGMAKHQNRGSNKFTRAPQCRLQYIGSCVWLFCILQYSYISWSLTSYRLSSSCCDLGVVNPRLMCIWYVALIW